MVTKFAAVLACFVLLAACGGSDGDEPTAPESPVPTTPTFDPPDGVELTGPGEPLSVGEEGTVVLSAGGETKSAVTVDISRVRTGSEDDFEDFDLGEELSSATAYYVDVDIENRGPAGIGGAAFPLYIEVGEEETYLPPNDIIGEFSPCEDRALPESLLPEESAEICLVYLVPGGDDAQGFAFAGADGSRVVWAYSP